ncbi:Zn-ribbon domain-containing OB-fold protein [Halovivax cerinus]|uniref:Zn-ribbon domain-containing OB-fold protein n=1 Tax=Halovivax cerinus TaxID=1487865 RepID=A0ABD5NPX0_9EURY|nr:hypothetical protein [Halovivax cerinus]
MSDAVPPDRAFVCTACDHRWYYTRQRCPACGAADADTYELGTGSVLATTTVHATPPGVRQPNPLAIVAFEHVSLVAQLADETIETGDAVTFGDEAVLRDGDEPIEGPRLVRSE